MNKPLLWALLSWLSLLSFGAQAQNLSVAETFEGLPTDLGYTNNTIKVYEIDPSVEYFDRRAFNTNGTYPGTTVPLSNREGAYTWAGKNVRSTGQTNFRPAGVVITKPIANSQNYKNFVITVAMAAPRGGAFTGSGSNTVLSTDRIRIQYAFGNNSWVTVKLLMGNNRYNTGVGDFEDITPLSDSVSVGNNNTPANQGIVLDQTYRDIVATLPATALGTDLRVRVVTDTRGPESAFDNIRITGVPDVTTKPTLTNLESTSAAYTEGSATPTPLTSALTVGYSDGSNTTLTGATVTIGNFALNQDVLNFTNQSSITGSYNTGTGILTLTGTASQAAYQAALRSITYSNSNTSTATGGTRQITFQVTNGGTLSAAVTRPLVVTAVLTAGTLNYTENFDDNGEGTRYFGNPFVETSTLVGFFRATTSPAKSGNTTIGAATFTGWSGGYWFGEGTDNGVNPNQPVGIVQLTSLNATGRTNIKFTLAVGAAGNWRAYFDANNPGDHFELFYRINGGALVKFAAFSGTGTNLGPPRLDADLNRQTLATGIQLGTALRDFTFTLPAETAGVGNLEFLLQQQATGGAELAFDNIRITGTALPTVTTTTPATSIQATSATLGGTVTADGGGTLTERGIVYVAGTGTPTTSNTKALVATSGIVVGTAFSGAVTGLTAGTQYTARAYAINEAGTSYGASVTFTTATTITSIVRADPSPTNAATVRFTVTFATPIAGLSTSNFSVTTDGTISGASISGLSGSGTTYTLTVNTGTGSGTQLQPNLINSTGLLPSVSNVPFKDESYAVDKVAPTVTSFTTTAGSSTSVAPIPFTVSFSEDVTGLTAADITVTNGTVSGAIGGTAPTAAYTFSVTPTSSGTVTVRIAANAVQDAAGNTNPASGTVSVTYTQPATAVAQNVTVNLDANGNATLNASSVNNGSTGGGTLTYTIQKIVYGRANESSSPTLTLTTPNGANFTAIRFASYGTPIDNGNGNYSLGSCNAANSLAAAQNAYVDRSSGTMYASNTDTRNNPVLGDPCGGTPKSLAVQAAYSADAASLIYTCDEAGKTQYVLLTVSNGSTTSTSVAQVTVNPPPTATISSVSPTAALRGATVTVTGTNLSGVTSLTVGGATATISNVSGNGFTFVVPSGASFGAGNLTVTAPCSQTLTPAFTVQQPVTPAPVVTTPANGSLTNNATPTYSGTAPANSVVTVYVGPSTGAALAVGTATAGASGTFSLPQPTALTDGQYQVYATAQLSNQAVSANSATNAFTVDTQRPTVSFRSAAGASGTTTTTTPIPFTVTFSESVFNFTSADIVVGNGTVVSFSGAGATYTFTVRPATAGTATTVDVAANVARDQANNGNTAAATYSLTFLAPTITLAPASLPQGTQSTAYSQTLTAAGGTAPYAFALTTGALPAGLSLTSAGVLSGTPTANGTFNFTVTVTDASTAPGPYSGSQAYTLVIAAPAITAVSWNGNTNTDWFNASNWTPNQVPDATLDVTIPTSPSGGRFPFITTNSSPANTRNLNIASGAFLTMTANTLILAANLTNNGTFQPTGGTVLLGNSTTSNILGASNTRFWNLTVGTNGAQQSTSATTSVQRLLLLNGNFTTNGNPFTLESNNTLTAMVVNNGGNVVNGNVTVQRYIDPSLNPGLGYRHYSAPVSNATVGGLTTASFTPVVNAAYNTSPQPGTVTPFPTVYGYDQSRLSTATNNLSAFDKGWFSPTTLSDALTVGQGYTVNLAANQTLSLTGPLNNGIVSQNLTRNSNATAPDAGWQLLGNPYPSPLDYAQVAAADRPGLDAAIYVFESSSQYGGSYRASVNGVGGNANSPNSLLAQGQGFFVRVSSGQTSGTLTLRNNYRPTTYTSPTYLRTAETRPLVQLDLQSATGTDPLFVYFQGNATASLDSELDALKLPNTTGLNVSAEAGAQRLAINALPVLGTAQVVVPLAVGVPAAGSFSLKAAQLLNLATTPVYLRDLQTGAVVDLRAQPSYQFTVSNASALITGRFELVFSPQQPLATAPAALAQQVALYPNPAKKTAFVELPASLGRQVVTASLVDALGRVVRTVPLPAQGALAHQLDLSELATGVYALRLSTSAGVVVKKLVIE